MSTSPEKVPVLIVGGGLVGLAASMFLSHHGVRTILVDRHAGFSLQGRARGINPRTMEIYRSLGIDKEVTAAGKPFDNDWGVAFCQTFAGEWQWLFDEDLPKAWPDLTAAAFVLADQNMVEPILIETAAAKGAEHRFNTELITLDADADGVTAVVENGTTGERSTIRADYVIAADGNRSPIRERLGIKRDGLQVFQYSLTIAFTADLSEHVQRQALLWFIRNAGVSGSLAMGAVLHRWQFTIGYDPATETPADFTPQRCVEVVRAAVGQPDLPIEIEDVGAWEQAVGVAERYRAGRIFLAGDSAHVWPPAGALGANTGVQDAHNLAWKLAAVCGGWAGPELLDTYEVERHPIASELAPRIVRRQETRHSDPAEDQLDDQLWALGQRYWSAAVIGAEHTTVFGDGLDFRAQSGTRAPHLWLDLDGRRIAVHDLFHDGFVLLAGSEGTPWLDQAAELTGIPLRAYRIAAEADVDNRWSDRYGVGPWGAVLIRPDGYVAWRSAEPAGNSPHALRNALNKILAVE